MSITSTRDLWYLGCLLHLRAMGEDTGGAYPIVEEHLPAGFATPDHVHHREDEAFLVLEGALSFVMAGREQVAGPGDYVFLPRDVPHRFAATSPTARVLNIVSPAGFEHFFADLGEPAGARVMPPPPDGPPDVERMAGLLRPYGVELVGGPRSGGG